MKKVLWKIGVDWFWQRD